MIRSVIFDIEGVLVNTEEYQYRAWQHLAHEQGLFADASLIHSLMGRGRMDSINILLQRANRTYSETERMALALRKGDLFMEYTQQMSEKDILPGVTENLEKLRKQGYKLAAASSSRSGCYIMTRCGLRKSFDVIVDGTDISHSKPDPEIYTCTAGLLGVDPAECLVVEDGELGITAARKIGMTVLAVGEAMKDENAQYHAGGLETLDICGMLENGLFGEN